MVISTIGALCFSALFFIALQTFPIIGTILWWIIVGILAVSGLFLAVCIPTIVVGFIISAWDSF